jgi:chromosome segregation ATPase
MSKDIQLGPFVMTPRALNDVQFAAAIESLANGVFDVRHHFDSARNYRFTAHEHAIVVNTHAISVFLRDVKAILDANGRYARAEDALHRANREFADENCRLNASLSNERSANVTWEERYNAVKGKRDLLEADLAVANSAVAVIRERATGFQQELSAARSDLDEAVEQIKTLTRRNETQSESIGRYQEENEGLAHNVKSLMAKVGSLTNALAAQPDLQAIAEREQLMKRIESQRKTIIDFQQRQSEFNREKGSNETLREVNASLQAEIAALREANESFATGHIAKSKEATSQRPTRVTLTIDKDGSVHFDSGDAPVVITGNLSVTGELSV